LISFSQQTIPFLTQDYIYDGDRHLFALIAEGDEIAFRSIFDQYTSILLPYVTRFVNSAAIAEELVQEVFIRIWMNRDKLGEIENPRAWIFRIAANDCYVFLRRKELERKMHKRFDKNESVVATELSSYHELQKAIDEAVQKMPEKRKRIYLLSRVEGLKPSEIAERLDLSVSTVKNTLGTALESIRQHLIEKGLFVWACWIFLKNF
jgi:RNA polymerase sigma-70 factor (family 1)